MFFWAMSLNLLFLLDQLLFLEEMCKARVTCFSENGLQISKLLVSDD